MSQRWHRCRLLGLVLVALAAVSTSSLGQLSGATVEFDRRITLITPDSPGLEYTEFVNASGNETSLSFDRPSVHWTGNTHSPGTRINFTSDATRIGLRVDYESFLGGTGVGLFRVEVDGQLQSRGIGSSTATGVQTYEVFKQSFPQVHDFSLIYPYGADVDFLGLELSGGSPGLLGPPPPRPGFLYVAYGDSITHGYSASSIAGGYPYQVGAMRDWSVLNMGFFGRIVVPADGTAVGNLGGDRVSVAIGTNDWSSNTVGAAFTTNYADFLDNIRAVQPSVPIYAITPTWVVNEGIANGVGLTREDYRQLIRDEVFSRAATDPELYLLEGSVMVPPGLTFFPDGIHPNDVGFGFYASALGSNNLVAEPGFETDGFAWTDDGNSAVTAAEVFSGLESLEVGTGAGGAHQPVGRVRRGQDYVFSAWCKVGAAGETGEVGVTFYDAVGTELQNDEATVDWTTWQQASLLVSAPATFAWAEVWCSKPAGPSFLYVDDVELTEAVLSTLGGAGNGQPGTLGVPTLAARGTPAPGATLTLDLGNAFGRPTLSGLLFSRRELPFGSQLVTLPMPSNPGGLVLVPAEGLELPLDLPRALAGERILLRAWQADPGASGGLSTTRILSLTLGR